MVPVRSSVPALGLAAALVPFVVTLAACDDNRKASEQAAVDELGKLAPVLKEDVAQVRRGLPEGAAKLGPMLDKDTLGDNAALRKAIVRARAGVKDLEVAKSTFFSYADGDGKILRSEADPDVLADKSILASFPGLKKALGPTGSVAEVYADMRDLHMAKTGPDLIWAVAAPVKDDKGQPHGMFVTGWSLRALAYHLETSAKMTLIELSEKQGKKHPPLVYVYVVKGKTAYGPPGMPEVNAKAVEDADLLGKTAGGAYHGNLEITGRAFGIAGVRVPEMGDDAALAVIASAF